MNLFNGNEDLQRRYADALKTSVDKTFGVDMNNEPVAWMHKNPDYPISKHWSQEYNIPLYTHPVKEQELLGEINRLKQIIDANNLNQNIGQFIKQKPDAFKTYDKQGNVRYTPWDTENGIPLYTHPVKEQELLDEIAHLKHLNRNWQISENILLLELEKLQDHPVKDLNEEFEKGFKAGKEEGWKAHKFHHPVKELTDEEIDGFEYRIIRACGLSTANSDINPIAIKKIIKEIRNK